MSKEIKKRTSQKTETEYLKYSIGEDISKEKFDACISIIDKEQYVKVVASRTFTNNENGFKAFLEWKMLKCKLKISSVFVMEATGIYYERLAWFLHRNEQYLSVVLPNKSKKYMQSIGIKSKNDKIDAAGLSRMGAEQKLSEWNAPTQMIVELRDFTRQRESLQESRTIFNN
jgi:transposase